MKYFDGHNDCLLRLFQSKSPDPAQLFFTQRDQGHIDLPRLLKGGFCGGFFAIYVPADPLQGAHTLLANSDHTPLAKALDTDYARRCTITMASVLLRLVDRSQGHLSLITSRTALDNAISQNRLAVIFHLEGAEAIDADLALTRSCVVAPQYFCRRCSVSLSEQSRHRRRSYGSGHSINSHLQSKTDFN